MLRVRRSARPLALFFAVARSVEAQHQHHDLAMEMARLQAMFASKHGSIPPSASASLEEDPLKQLSAQLDAMESVLTGQQLPMTIQNNLTLAHESAKNAGLGERGGTAGATSGNDEGFFTVQRGIGCLILLLLGYAAWLYRSTFATAPSSQELLVADSTTDVGTRAARQLSRQFAPPVEVFRMSAMRDRYDYYQPMDAPEGDYEADAVLPWSQLADRFSGRRMVVVLEKAALELAWSYSEREPTDRENPLIAAHECLLTLLDSPLNKAGLLLIYIHSVEDKLVEVHPSCRLPRLFRAFEELMYELLQTGEIAGQQANFPLLKIVPGPVQMNFPRDCRRIALSCAGSHHAPVRDLCAQLTAEPGPETEVVVFAVGVSDDDATTQRQFGATYCEQSISICPWGLRSSSVCRMLCHEFENLWGVYRRN